MNESAEPKRRRKRRPRSRRLANSVKPTIKKKKELGRTIAILTVLVLLVAIGGQAVYRKYIANNSEWGTRRDDVEAVSNDLAENKQIEIDNLFEKLLRGKSMEKQSMTRRRRRQLLSTRLKFADRILEKEISTSERYVASREKSDALLQLHEGQFGMDAKLHLQRFADELLESEDQALTQLSKFFLTKLSIADFLINPNSGFDSAMEAIEVLIAEYPTSKSLANEMIKVIDRMILLRYNDEASRVLQFLIGKYAEVDEPALVIAREKLQDLKILLELKFGDQIMMVKNSPQDAAAKKKLWEAIEVLCDDENLTMGVCENVVRASRFFETAHRHDEMAKVNEILLRKGATNSRPEVAELAKTEALESEVRRSWLGRPFDIQGGWYRGKKVDATFFQGKVTAVIFWTAKDSKGSLMTLSTLNRIYLERVKEGFDVVGINVDENPEPAQALALPKRFKWPMLYQGTSDEDVLQLREKFGIGFVPYVLLLDRQGRVAYLNMSSVDVLECIDELLNQSLEEGDAAK